MFVERGTFPTTSQAAQALGASPLKAETSTSYSLGLVLQPGMMFTIEPMINAGKPQTKQLPDGWTVVTKDRSLSAQWEHMVVVTDTGYEVLTSWPDGFGDYPPIP